MVLLEHGFLRVGWVAHIILNSSPFEEGAIWIGFIVSFLQRSQIYKRRSLAGGIVRKEAGQQFGRADTEQGG